MEYEVYRHNDATDEEFTQLSDFFKAVMQEDKFLCNGVQKNLESGIFLSGELHPRVEKVIISDIFHHVRSTNLCDRAPSSSSR